MSKNLLGVPLRLILTLLIAAVFVVGSEAPRRAPTSATVATTTAMASRVEPIPFAVDLPVPAALTDPGLGLRAGPVPVALELQIPSTGVRAPVVGVGITPRNVMDAPMGAADDPVWQEGFWYRGSAVPGALSTALIAGHADDSLGRPGVFAHLDRLKPGDLIVVRDIRTELDVTFSVTESTTYSLDQTTDQAVLAQIYGEGPVGGNPPQPSVDGLAHLTLITCAGKFKNGTHDHRLVVYATRIA